SETKIPPDLLVSCRSIRQPQSYAYAAFRFCPTSLLSSPRARACSTLFRRAGCIPPAAASRVHRRRQRTRTCSHFFLSKRPHDSSSFGRHRARARAFGEHDGPQTIDARLERVVDDDVVVFADGADLLARRGEAAPDGRLRILAAAAQPPLEDL